MNIQEYLVESARTYSTMQDASMNNQHAAIGIFTETGELLDIFKKNLWYGKEIDLVNFKEELGDIMWYVAMMYRYYKVNVGILEYHTETPLKLVIKIAQESTGLLHAVDDEHHIADDENTAEWVAIMLDSIVAIVQHLALTMCNATLEDVFQTNINKLRTRYPEKFTSENAINRDLDAEHNVLAE